MLKIAITIPGMMQAQVPTRLARSVYSHLRCWPLMIRWPAPSSSQVRSSATTGFASGRWIVLPLDMRSPLFLVRRLSLRLEDSGRAVQDGQHLARVHLLSFLDPHLEKRPRPGGGDLMLHLHRFEYD